MLSAHPDPRVVTAARALSRLGEHAGVWLVAGAAGAVLQPHRRQQWAAATARVAAAHLASSAIKHAVRRPRPPGHDVTGAAFCGRWSFPSSHSASSAAAAAAFSGLLPTAVVPVLAGGVMASRLVLRAHHPSDVLAGALLGAAVGRAGRHRTRRGGLS